MKRMRPLCLIIIIIISLLVSACQTKITTQMLNKATESSLVLDAQRLAAIPASADAFAGGTGSLEDPYQIATPAQLYRLAMVVNSRDRKYASASYVLTADINLNDTFSLERWSTMAPANGWRSIGDGTDYSSFSGTFDGQGHKISGLYQYAAGSTMAQPELSYGLFGRVKEAKIRNLSIISSYLYIPGQSRGLGTIAGNAYQSVIENCSSEVTIRSDVGGTEVGGIVGSMSGGLVRSCVSKSNVSGADFTAGIVGAASFGCSIERCRNEGSVQAEGKSAEIAGIVGRLNVFSTFGEAMNPTSKYQVFQGVVSNCVNTGRINGLYDAGGIICTVYSSDYKGHGSQVDIRNCINEGKVNGTHFSAGVIARISCKGCEVRVTECINAGDIPAGDHLDDVAGIVALVQSSNNGVVKIAQCINERSISVKHSTVGGIVASSVVWMGGQVRIANSQNRAELASSGGGYVGGIIGYAVLGYSSQDAKGSCMTDVADCINTGTIKGAAFGVGGIVGALGGMGNVAAEGDAANVTHCINSGKIETWNFTTTGGIVGCTSTEGGPVIIMDCENDGDITHTYQVDQNPEDKSLSYIGGIVGLSLVSKNHSGKVQVISCINKAEITTENSRQCVISDQIGKSLIVAQPTPTPKTFENQDLQNGLTSPS